MSIALSITKAYNETEFAETMVLTGIITDGKIKKLIDACKLENTASFQKTK